MSWRNHKCSHSKNEWKSWLTRSRDDDLDIAERRRVPFIQHLLKESISVIPHITPAIHRFQRENWTPAKCFLMAPHTKQKNPGFKEFYLLSQPYVLSRTERQWVKRLFHRKGSSAFWYISRYCCFLGCGGWKESISVPHLYTHLSLIIHMRLTDAVCSVLICLTPTMDLTIYSVFFQFPSVLSRLIPSLTNCTMNLNVEMNTVAEIGIEGMFLLSTHLLPLTS